ncbi:M48 family metallopeptidase [Neobacillus jeddahensis]|uniref:M48 family metallopeptidase n=1 Tax=Neobacillus jeddahensis TaxID=1461580 RepID=UPI00058B4E9C|nr:SprT family zinc-dependent metalloprotease [Neobacillus jeddahensis]
MIHKYLGQAIRFEIKYKKRTSMSIAIDLYGNIEIQAPKGTSEERVLQIVEEKWEWIQQKIKEMNDRSLGPKVKTYDQGESGLYLGNDYPIQVSQDITIKQDYVVLEKEKIHIIVQQLEDEKIKQALKRFYYQQCKMFVERSIRSHQRHFKIKPRSIRITDNKTNWGTCDAKQQLTFNWKLAMAPLEVIDYVVVHEMCHMVHLNHDRSFWRLVGKILPDYEQRENWLALSSWKMNV